jgi:hypothetical protein
VALRQWIAAALISAISCLHSVQAQETTTEASFGLLAPMTLQQAREQSRAWLTQIGKLSEPDFNRIWNEQEDKSILDRLSEVFRFGSQDAAKLIDESLRADIAPPKTIPSLFKDDKQPTFFRSNLATIYARGLATNRVYEEALGTLSLITADKNLADPGTFLFYKAVSQYGLMKKREARDTIEYLLGFVPDAPERYKMLSTIMFVDLQGWKEEQTDLGNIAKLMDNVERRLDLGRGGKETQEIQKKIVFRLDELIKEKENQAKGQGQANNGSCPDGGKPQPGPGTNQPTSPMQDSNIANNGGPGKVDDKKLRQYAENWGKMNDRDRTAALTEVTRDLPPKYKVIVEEYFRSLSRSQP